MMMINTVEVAMERLEKRSHIYSDRPRSIHATLRNHCQR